MVYQSSPPHLYCSVQGRRRHAITSQHLLSMLFCYIRVTCFCHMGLTHLNKRSATLRSDRRRNEHDTNASNSISNSTSNRHSIINVDSNSNRNSNSNTLQRRSPRDSKRWSEDRGSASCSTLRRSLLLLLLLI